ncbi:MAG: type II toxin-antitoxin system PemK/MazF family toxin [Ilumatobacteraceae bacterium]
MDRGDVYVIDLPRGLGHEQHGKRFAVIVQSDALLPRSIVLVAPTSTSAKPASIRPEITIQNQTTRVLIEQLSAIATDRLGKRIAHIDIDEQWAIDNAVLTVLGLNYRA